MKAFDGDVGDVFEGFGADADSAAVLLTDEAGTLATGEASDEDAEQADDEGAAGTDDEDGVDDFLIKPRRQVADVEDVCRQ